MADVRSRMPAAATVPLERKRDKQFKAVFDTMRALKRPYATIDKKGKK